MGQYWVRNRFRVFLHFRLLHTHPHAGQRPGLCARRHPSAAAAACERVSSSSEREGKRWKGVGKGRSRSSARADGRRSYPHPPSAAWLRRPLGGVTSFPSRVLQIILIRGKVAGVLPVCVYYVDLSGFRKSEDNKRRLSGGRAFYRSIFSAPAPRLVAAAAAAVRLARLVRRKRQLLFQRFFVGRWPLVHSPLSRFLLLFYLGVCVRPSAVSYRRRVRIGEGRRKKGAVGGWFAAAQNRSEDYFLAPRLLACGVRLPGRAGSGGLVQRRVVVVARRQLQSADVQAQSRGGARREEERGAWCGRGARLRSPSGD